MAWAGGEADAGTVARSHSGTNTFLTSSRFTPDYDKIWAEAIGNLGRDQFALLDVSSNADLLGVSFGSIRRRPRGNGDDASARGNKLSVAGQRSGRGQQRSQRARLHRPADFLGAGDEPSRPRRPRREATFRRSIPRRSRRSARIIILTTAARRGCSTTASSKSRWRRSR